MEDTPPRPITTNELLAPLQESILKKPRYICLSGMLQLLPSSFSLFYKVTKDGHASRYIDLANATFDELEQLAQACQPASLSVVEEGTTKELYCKVGKMDSECYASVLAPEQTRLGKLIGDYLSEGSQTKSRSMIEMELQELNVYTQGSFSKSRVETPRREKMIGSLVIVFPTPHEGGALLVRHRGKEWSFDIYTGWPFGPKASDVRYVVLFNDVEHEVTPVTFGHRVTLTYNLYHPASEKDPVAGPFSSPPAYERRFRESLEALLQNPELLPYGGTLGFGLRHSYPIRNEIRHIYGLLKASDAVIYRSFRALGFQPALYMYVEKMHYGYHPIPLTEGGLSDRVDNFQGFDEEDNVDLIKEVLRKGGHVVYYDDLYRLYAHGYEGAEMMEWVTPRTKVNRQESTYHTYGNEPTEEIAYWDLCLVVRIGKAGERLMYPTIAQLKKKLERDDQNSQFWHR